MKTSWKNYTIEAEFAGDKDSSWDPHSYDRHHIITVTNDDTGVSNSFDYWTSKAHPQMTEERQLLEAVECFFTDAEFGQYDFEEFCRESGYDIPNGIYKSWKACVNASCKVNRVFGRKWQDLANELREEEM